MPFSITLCCLTIVVSVMDPKLLMKILQVTFTGGPKRTINNFSLQILHIRDNLQCHISAQNYLLCLLQSPVSYTTFSIALKTGSVAVVIVY